MLLSHIKSIGESSYFDTHNILILFGPSVPDYMEEFVIVHEFDQQPQETILEVGSKLFIGDFEYTVEDIGSVANQTLCELGHASLYFGLEEGSDLLPGSILLSPYVMPKLSLGDTLIFVR